MKKLNFILFTLIYFAATMVLMGSQYRPLPQSILYARYAIILVLFSLIAFIYLYKNGLRIYRFSSFLSMYLFLIWLLFSASVFISEIYHNSFPNQSLFFLLAVPFIYFTVMPYMTKQYGQVIFPGLFASSMLYLLISYITVPFEIPYSGVAANTNGFGQIAAISFISAFICLVAWSKGRTLSKLVIVSAMLLSLFSIFISFSRTSFLVVGIVSFIMIAYFLGIRRNFKPLIAIIVAGLIIWYTPLKETLITGLLDKFTSLNQQGNFLHGRFDTWIKVIKEAQLFGHGEDYFEHFFETAHNSIINILGVYGIIPALLLTVFLILALVLSFLYAIRHSKDRNAIFPFVIIVTFTAFSLTEAMFGLVGNGITIAFYHVIGILLFNRNSKIAN